MRWMILLLLAAGCATDVTTRYTAERAAVCSVLPDACDAIIDVPVLEVDSTEGYCAPAGPACYRLDEHVIYIQAHNKINPWSLLTHEYLHAALDALDMDDNHGPIFRSYLSKIPKETVK